jgi:succinyl-CoA synthetase beta subunit
VLVAQRHFIRREAYFAILLDRKTSSAVMIGSRFGGMDIEAVAEQNPNAIIKVNNISS